MARGACHYLRTRNKRTTNDVSKVDVDKLLELVDKAGFWAAQSTEPQPDENSRKYYVLDGAWWMLEGVQNGSFHFVFHRNPKPTPITEIGCYLTKNLVKFSDSVIPMPGCTSAIQTNPAVTTPAQTIPQQLWGKWVVTREIPTTTISCWGSAEAKNSARYGNRVLEKLVPLEKRGHGASCRGECGRKR